MDKYTMQECKFWVFPVAHLALVSTNDSENINLFENAKVDEEWEYKHKYELYGIVTHSGGMGGGHYIAYVWYL